MSRVLAHARWELGILLRNGEQILLTLLIPLGLLLLVRDLAPVIAASVLASMFTSLAISTGFERRSGALRFLGVTPLRRVELLLGKLLASLSVLIVSCALTVTLAAVLGCLPAWSLGQALIAVALILTGSAAAAGWGLLLAGTVRAEAVLAVANGVFIVLVLTAVTLPGSLGSPWSGLVLALPSVALAHGLAAPALAPLAILGLWAAVGAWLAAHRFDWDG